MKKAWFFILSAYLSIGSAGDYVNEVTCDVEGSVTPLFFDGQSDAEGVLPTGELIVARSIQWSDWNLPALSTLENIAMEIEFPFRLEGQKLDCEVYHPSRWWFNSPEFMEVLKRYAPEPAEG